MTPVMQTVTGPRGNCMSACFASVFDLPISDVPNFYEITSDDAGWWLAVRKWLAGRGFGILDITFEEAAQWQHLQLSGAHIVSGPAPRVAVLASRVQRADTKRRRFVQRLHEAR